MHQLGTRDTQRMGLAKGCWSTRLPLHACLQRGGMRRAGGDSPPVAKEVGCTTVQPGLLLCLLLAGESAPHSKHLLLAVQVSCIQANKTLMCLSATAIKVVSRKKSTGEEFLLFPGIICKLFAPPTLFFLLYPCF